MTILLTSLAVTGVAPILIYLWPAPPKGQKKTPLKISLSKPATDLQNGEAVQFYAPKTPNAAFIMADGGGDNAPGDLAFGGFLVKDQSGKVDALAINCSHLGCSVALNQSTQSFLSYSFDGLNSYYTSGSRAARYNDFDRALIRTLYHTSVTPGMPDSAVKALFAG